MFSLIPREEKFFDCFEKLADLAKTAAECFDEMLNNPDLAGSIYIKLDQLENSADDCVREIHQKLDRCFITPIDREDISALTGILDDIVDKIESAGRMVALFAKHLNGSLDYFSLLLPHARGLSQKLFQSSQILPDTITKCLRKPNRVEAAKRHAMVHALENAADDIWEGDGGALDTYIGNLAADLRAPATKGDLLMLEWKELCHDIERITDLVKNTVDMISSIVDKND